MAQGNNKKLLTKLVRKGNRGFPVATVACYGPSDKLATKIACGILKTEGASADVMRRWHSKTEIRKSEIILGEVLAFIKEYEAKSVSMLDQIIGCPHEEEVDYPIGKPCPECKFWENRDRFTHEKLN